MLYAVFLAPYRATEKTWQYFMREDFPHEILPRPAAAIMLSNCKHAHKPRPKSDSKMKARFPRSAHLSDPSDDHATVGVGPRRNAGRNISVFFRL